MQHAEMTAFTDASRVLSTNIGWLETWLTSPEQHIQSPRCFLYQIIIDDIRILSGRRGSLNHKSSDNESVHSARDYFIYLTLQNSGEAFACFDMHCINSPCFAFSFKKCDLKLCSKKKLLHGYFTKPKALGWFEYVISQSGNVCCNIECICVCVQ